MNEVSDCKIREVIPDLTNKVGKMIETMTGIQRSITRLNDALNGTRPSAIEANIPNPQKGDAGSIEVLERTIGELYTLINDADLELREKLALLLGA